MGVFDVSAASALVGVVVMEAHLRGCCLRWGFLCLWVSGCEDLGCPPCGGHEVLRGVVMAQPLPVVPVNVMVTQPLPGVPVDVMVTQPLPWSRWFVVVIIVVLRAVCCSTVLGIHGLHGPLGGGGPGWGRPLLLHPGLPGRPVLCGVGGCTG